MIMAGTYTTLRGDAHADETNSLDVTRKTNFHLFLQKVTLRKTILTSFKATGLQL